MVDDRLGLYVVADGMGGHSAGEVASAEAVDAIHGMVVRDLELLETVDALSEAALEAGDGLAPPLQRAVRLMESAVQAATYMVFGLSEVDPERKGMGTTISAMLLRGHFAITAQVGDSRIYLVRDGAAHQVTEDHTLVAWQIRKGLITEEEALHSRQKNVITRAVGSRDYVQVDTQPFRVCPGDRFVLCSDGLHGYVTAAELPDLVRLGPQLAATRSVDMANQRGGRDNITSLVVALD